MVNTGRGGKPKNLNKHSYIVTITEPDNRKEITIPLHCEGWCVRGVRVLENTTNDSILIWRKYFAPGQTGKAFSMECYDCHVGTVWTTQYIPYKATKGKIVLEWFLHPG
jgi:hypothetical protein